MNRVIFLITLVGVFFLTSPARADFFQDMKNKVNQAFGKKDDSGSVPEAQPMTENEKLLQKKEAEMEMKRKAFETGTLKTYYDDKKKKIKEEQTFKQGIPHGSAKIYYENGKLKAEGKYIKGKREGVFKFYSDKGTLTEEKLYKDGVLVDQRLYNEKGKLRSIVR